MTVGKQLKKLRKELGLSQQELSKRIGMNRSTYARYETDDNQADYETLQKLADFFHTSVDYLLGRTEVRTVPEHEGTDRDPYDVSALDLQKLIRDTRPLYFGEERLDLNEEEQKEFLRHMKLAWLMIKEKRQEQGVPANNEKKG